MASGNNDKIYTHSFILLLKYKVLSNLLVKKLILNTRITIQYGPFEADCITIGKGGR